jgi:hypothetical protein
MNGRFRRQLKSSGIPLISAHSDRTALGIGNAGNDAAEKGAPGRWRFRGTPCSAFAAGSGKGAYRDICRTRAHL